MNTRMRGLTNPLAARGHIDLHAVMTARFDYPAPMDRDEFRRLENLPPNPRRYRALDDALDLTNFLKVLLDRSAST